MTEKLSEIYRESKIKLDNSKPVEEAVSLLLEWNTFEKWYPFYIDEFDLNLDNKIVKNWAKSFWINWERYWEFHIENIVLTKDELIWRKIEFSYDNKNTSSNKNYSLYFLDSLIKDWNFDMKMFKEKLGRNVIQSINENYKPKNTDKELSELKENFYDKSM